MYDLILFTHTDMDGYGCKIVMDVAMNIIGNNNYRVVPCGHGNFDKDIIAWLKDTELDPPIGANTTIVFSDLCPSEQLLREWLVPFVNEGRIKAVKIYDHHETNLFATSYIPDACIIPGDESAMDNPCGTSLLYRAISDYIYLHKFPTDHINEHLFANVVEKIRSYDTYEWKLTDDVEAKKLQLMFSMIGGDNFVKKYVNRVMEGGTNTELFTETELEFIDSKYNYTNDVVSRITPDDFVTILARGYRVALMMKSVPASINEVADRFLEAFPEYDMVAQLSLFGNWQLSFRSRKDNFNSAVSFAEPMGGGGHKKASGAPVPEFIKNAITDMIVRYLNGEDLRIQVATEYEGGND